MGYNIFYSLNLEASQHLTYPDHIDLPETYSQVKVQYKVISVRLVSILWNNSHILNGRGVTSFPLLGILILE